MSWQENVHDQNDLGTKWMRLPLAKEENLSNSKNNIYSTLKQVFKLVS